MRSKYFVFGWWEFPPEPPFCSAEIVICKVTVVEGFYVRIGWNFGGFWWVRLIKMCAWSLEQHLLFVNLHLSISGVEEWPLLGSLAQWAYKESGGIAFAVSLVGLRFSRMWGRTSCEVRVLGAKEGGPYNPFVNLGSSHFAAESPMPALMWSSNLRLCKSCISLLHMVFFIFLSILVWA